jgi:hypothetical protein
VYCIKQLHAVVDWNPSGLLIYSTYKYGSKAARQQHSQAQHALPGLQLLAVRGEMLQGVPQHVLQATDCTTYTKPTTLTPACIMVASNQRSVLAQTCRHASWRLRVCRALDSRAGPDVLKAALCLFFGGTGAAEHARPGAGGVAARGPAGGGA